MPGKTRFRARIGETTVDLALEEGRVFVDSREHGADLQPIGPQRYSLLLDSRSYTLFVSRKGPRTLEVTIDGRATTVFLQDDLDLLVERDGTQVGGSESSRSIRAPMPGLVVAVFVSEGDTVEPGTGLVILEAMKMENELQASELSLVKSILVRAGDAVGKGDVLVELGPIGMSP